MNDLDLTDEEVAWLQNENEIISNIKGNISNHPKRSPLKDSDTTHHCLKKIKTSPTTKNFPPSLELELGPKSPDQSASTGVTNAANHEGIVVGTITVIAENVYMKGPSSSKGLSAGKVVEIYASVPSLGAKKSFKPSARFRLNDNGMEIGRIYRDACDTSSFLVNLLESGLATLNAEILFVPPFLKSLDEIILSVQIILLSKAFAPRPLKNEAEDDPFDKPRKVMLVELFQRTGLLDNGKAKRTLAAHKAGDSTFLDPKEDHVSSDDLARIYNKSESMGLKLKGMKPAKGMILTLRNYQEVGLSFMFQKETSLLSSDAATGISPLWDIISPPDSSTFYFNSYSGVISVDPPKERPTLGGILADDMGLGKTIEMLALIHTNRFSSKPSTSKSLNGKPKSRSTLIVCPLNLLTQWRDEALRSFEEDINVFIYHGNDRKQSLSFTKASAPLIVLTTFGTLSSEFANEPASGLYSVHWHRICLDEAHYIKEKSTKAARACYALQGTYRWVITGTPVVNKLDDLYSLLKFLKSDPWEAYAFWRAYVIDPFLRNDPEALKTIQTILEPIIIRRTKDMTDSQGNLLIPLPPKHQNTVWLKFSPSEEEMYAKLQSYSKEKVKQLEKEGNADYIHIFALLLRMRQMCSHSLLIKNNSDTDERLSKILESDMFIQNQLEAIKSDDVECPVCFESMSSLTLLPCKHLFCKSCIQEIIDREDTDHCCPICREKWEENDIFQFLLANEDSADVFSAATSSAADVKIIRQASMSTKLEKLVSSIKELQKSDPLDKIIVFSQWTSFLDLVEPVLPVSHVRLDGKMSKAKREASIKAFKEDSQVKVLVASLRSCGVGLNLTVANRIFFTDLWWNISTENQAIDRCHRLGQTKPVYVYRLIIKDTIEERIIEMQDKKMTLTNHVIENADVNRGHGKATVEAMLDLF